MGPHLNTFTLLVPLWYWGAWEVQEFVSERFSFTISFRRMPLEKTLLNELLEPPPSICNGAVNLAYVSSMF